MLVLTNQQKVVNEDWAEEQVNFRVIGSTHLAS